MPAARTAPPFSLLERLMLRCFFFFFDAPPYSAPEMLTLDVATLSAVAAYGTRHTHDAAFSLLVIYFLSWLLLDSVAHAMSRRYVFHAYYADFLHAEACRFLPPRVAFRRCRRRFYF